MNFPPPMPSLLDLLMPPMPAPVKTSVPKSLTCGICGVHPRIIRRDGTYDARCMPCRTEYNKAYYWDRKNKTK